MVAASALGGGGLVVYKDQRWTESPFYLRLSTTPARVAVVVYSRSGNTLLAAKEAAAMLDADLVRVRSSRYPRSLCGQFQASSDADDGAQSCPIEHAPFDPLAYEHIVLCSPVWWYRPAVPLWAFVGDTAFGGREVSLLMTGNSRYEPDAIDEFAASVAASGGRFVGTSFVARGRVLWQKSADELAAEVRVAVDDQAAFAPYLGS